MSTPSLWAAPPAIREPEREPDLQPPLPPAPEEAHVVARRRPARPRPRVVDAMAALAGIGLGVVLAFAISSESSGSLQADGGIATALGRVAGLVAMYAMVVVVLLVARMPWLERAVGMDRLIGWHRRLGPWPLYLIAGHGVLITIGYAQAAHDGLLHQLGQLLWTYPGILAATVGFVLLIAAGVTSYRKARRRMAYETWWSVHLYTYLALFLSFSHQVGTGAAFVGHPLATLFWKALFWGTAAIVAACRIGLPAWRSLRHRVRVAAVRPAGPGLSTVVLEGRRLNRLPVAGGQFLQWRFLRPGQWWQAHPYSLSAAPRGNRLEITVKDLGDHSGGLATIVPGTRVAIEGPYGAFTHATPSPPTGCCSSARASAPRRSARCSRSCPSRPTSSCCCAPPPARSSPCATRSSPRSAGGAVACTSSSARASASTSPRGRSCASPPT